MFDPSVRRGRIWREANFNAQLLVAGDSFWSSSSVRRVPECLNSATGTEPCPPVLFRVIRHETAERCDDLDSAALSGVLPRKSCSVKVGTSFDRPNTRERASTTVDLPTPLGPMRTTWSPKMSSAVAMPRNPYMRRARTFMFTSQCAFLHRLAVSIPKGKRFSHSSGNARKRTT